MLDIRFSSALTVMLLLAVAAEDASPTLSSAQLAEKLHTNPSQVRKLLVQLAHGGLVVCTKGRAGGARLARSAEEITLAEIYACAVDRPLWHCRPDSADVCEVTGHAKEYFAALTAQAEQAVLASLEGNTLAGGLRELRRLDRRPTRC